MWGLVFLPGCDGYGLQGAGKECADVGTGESCVGEEGYVVIDCRTTDFVAVGEFALGVVFGDVDDEVDGV